MFLSLPIKKNDSFQTQTALTQSTLTKAGENPRLREAAKLYEEQFLGEMVKAMRKTVSESDFLKPGMGEKIYRDQLDQQYVENWADQGGIGLADLIVEQFQSNQGQGPAKK